MLRVAETTSIAETKAFEEKIPGGRRNHAVAYLCSIPHFEPSRSKPPLSTFLRKMQRFPKRICMRTERSFADVPFSIQGYTTTDDATRTTMSRTMPAASQHPL